jgi:hypothetical protein
VIGRVVSDGSHAHPLQTWESALPVRVQKLSSRYFFSGRPELKAGSGLVKFRWPVSENGEWKYLSATDHPFYSEEQYTSAFYEGYTDYVEAVAKRIDPTDYDPGEKVVLTDPSWLTYDSCIRIASSESNNITGNRFESVYFPIRLNSALDQAIAQNGVTDG